MRRPILAANWKMQKVIGEAVTAGDADDRISLLMVEGAGHFFRDLYTYDVVEGIVAWLDSVQAE